MSEYIVTARKWRPMKFDDVAAQTHVTHTLKNAFRQNRLAHAYLFAGPRGVGKTTTARLLAKLVNCEHPTPDAEPDNTCEMCTEITEGRSFDVLEIDGASNRGVDEIRNLREAVRYGPAKGKYKVYIIDEVHMLTKEAFNALLKTLEEPPSRILFIFATTEVHKLPATIISRCQRFDFRRVTVDEIRTNLRAIATKEGISIDEDALLMIAKKGDGSLRDAQSIFDQVVALCGRSITKDQILQALNIVDQDYYFRVTDLVKAKDGKGGLDLVQEIMERGYDLRDFLAGLTEHLRNILTVVTTGSTTLIEESDYYRNRYAEVAKHFSVADVLRLLRFVNSTEAALRWSSQPRFKLETDIVQMIMMNSAAEVGEVLDQIEELKKKLSEHRPSPTLASGRTPALSEPTPSLPKFGARPTFARRTPATETGTQHEPSVTLAEAEVRSRWAEFIGEVRRQRIALGTMLESAVLMGVQGSAIRLSVADEFTSSAIARNKELLQSSIQKIFHVRGRLDVEVNPTIPTSHRTPDEQEAPSPREEEHPVVKAMIRELGAEPL